MGNFDRYSNKPDKAPFLGVTFGLNKLVLEVELNEAQQIQNERMLALMNIHGDCVIDRDGFSYDGTTLTFNTKVVKDGVMIDTIGTVFEVSNGESVYIKSEFVDYSFSDTIHANGNTNGEVIENTLKDTRRGLETTRRKGYKFTINKESGMLLGTVMDNKFVCLAKDYNSGVRRYIGDNVSAPSKVGGVKLNRLYGKSEQKQYSGKNLLNPTLETTTSNGVTCANNGDGTYTVNGTATANAYQSIGEYLSIENISRLRLVGVPEQGILKMLVNYYNESNVYIIGSEVKNISFTVDIDNVRTRYPNITKVRLLCWVNKGDTVDNAVFKPMLTTDLTATYDDFEPYVGGMPSPSPEYPQEIKSVVNPVVTVTDADGTNTKTASLPYTLNAIPVESGGNVTIDGQQYIADYVDFEKKQLVRCVEKIESYNEEEITTNFISTTGELSTGATVFYELSESTTVDITDNEVQAFRDLATYYPTTNVITSSDQLSPSVLVEISSVESSARLIKAENDIHDIKGNSLVFKRTIGFGEDLNDITETGIYSISTLGADGLGNYPPYYYNKSSAVLEVVRLNETKFVLQTYTIFNNGVGRIYKRIYNGVAWSDWCYVQTSEFGGVVEICLGDSVDWTKTELEITKETTLVELCEKLYVVNTTNSKYKHHNRYNVKVWVNNGSQVGRDVQSVLGTTTHGMLECSYHNGTVYLTFRHFDPNATEKIIAYNVYTKINSKNKLGTWRFVGTTTEVSSNAVVVSSTEPADKSVVWVQ